MNVKGDYELREVVGKILWMYTNPVVVSGAGVAIGSFSHILAGRVNWWMQKLRANFSSPIKAVVHSTQSPSVN